MSTAMNVTKQFNWYNYVNNVFFGKCQTQLDNQIMNINNHMTIYMAP